MRWNVSLKPAQSLVSEFMLLVFDIGNTNIVVGIFENQTLRKTWRLISSDKKSADDYAVDLVEIFLNEKIDCLNITATVIGSVVPKLTGTIYEAVKKFTNGKILIAGEDNAKPKIQVKLKNKKEVGIDRLLNAIAAYKKFGGNLIIIDFGTATTFDVVNVDGEYIGGAICAGVNLSLKALHDMTAQLPKINIKAQTNVIGASTIEAMNSGAYFGYISLIEGMIAKIEKELGNKTIRVITGGLSNLFKDALKDLIDHHEPNLTLEGLKMLYSK